MKRLTLKQELFIEAYVATGNATEAARRAGYRGNAHMLQIIGAENMRKPVISAAIASRVEKAREAIGADEVLEILTAQARADIGDLARSDGTLMSVIEAKRAGVSRLVKRLEFSPRGVTKIELHDAQSAATTLGKFHGLWKEDAPNDRHVRDVVEQVILAVTDTLEEYVGDVELREKIKTGIGARLDSGYSGRYSNRSDAR